MKGLIPTTSHILLLVLVGGVVAVTIGGPILDALSEGNEALNEYTGISEYQTVSDAKTLAELSHFVWDRAVSCSDVDGKEYPGLSETEYGTDPSCIGASGTPLATPLVNTFGGDTGDDMEGKYGRIKFKITESITLTSYKNSPPYNTDTGWADGYHSHDNYDFRIRTASKHGESFQDLVASECGGYPMSVMPGAFSAGDDPNNPNAFTVAYDVPQTDIDESKRFSTIGNGLFWEGIKTQHIGDGSIMDKPFCLSKDTGTHGYMAANKPLKHVNGEEGRVKMQLCPGDEGYIQVNKGYSFETGEFLDYSAASMNARYFPHIVITEVNQSSCGDISSPPQVPPGTTTEGNVLQIRMDAGAEYPELHMMTMFDTSEGQNLDTINQGNDYYTPDTDKCRLSLYDIDDMDLNDGPDHVDFDKGTHVSRSGEFPGKDQDGVYPALTGGNMDTGVTSEADPGDVYNDLSTKGFNGADISGKYDLLLNQGSHSIWIMHGDILCGKRPAWDWSKWVLCDPKNDPDPITVGGETWNCDPTTGNWAPE